MASKFLAWEIGTLLWLGGALTLLRIGTVEGYAESNALCGPWGCLPPTAALVAMHGFWFMVLGLLCAFTIGLGDPIRVRQIGRILASIGLLGLIGFLGWVFFTWQSAYGAMTSHRFAMRFLHFLLTKTDVPVMQCGIAGVVLMAVVLRSRPARTGNNAGADCSIQVATLANSSDAG